MSPHETGPSQSVLDLGIDPSAVRHEQATEAAPKKEEAEEEEDDNLVPAEPKVTNPLDLLPKSNFNLETWKRQYSNLDTRGAGGSLEWFYQKCVLP